MRGNCGHGIEKAATDLKRCIGKIGAVFTGVGEGCCGSGGVFGGESAAGESGVSEDADVVLGAPREDFGFGLAGEEIVGELEGFDPSELDGFVEEGEWEIGDAEVEELFLEVELSEGVEGFAQGRVGIGPVDLKEGDGVDFESAEAGVDGLSDGTGAEIAIDAMIFVPKQAAFGGDDSGAALGAEGVSEEFFGVAETVDIRNVEEIDAAIEGFAHCGTPCVLVDGAVVMARGGTAAETDAGDLQVCLAEPVVLQLAPHDH